MRNNTKKERVTAALKYIIPFLKKYNFRWCISGGFACYLYGVKRPIPDIDIDVEADKDAPKFRNFLGDVKCLTTLPFQRWITADKNYDNWVMEVTIDNQVLSICTTKNLKLLNKESGRYELFYKKGIPGPTVVNFEGLQLPLSPKEWVIKMKEALAKKKAADQGDIAAMQKLLLLRQ